MHDYSLCPTPLPTADLFPSAWFPFTLFKTQRNHLLFNALLVASPPIRSLPMVFPTEHLACFQLLALLHLFPMASGACWCYG